MVQNNIPFDGLIDCSPASYIQRSDAVSGVSEAARHASESVSCRPVLFIDVMADRALPACVPRVDGEERSAREGSLVFYELPELPECPRRVVTALCLSNGCPLDVAFQFLPFSAERN